MSEVFNVDGWNNFCRIFELPEKLSSDFCFGGGIDTNFKMVDWFNPVPGLPNPAVSKDIWIKEVGKIPNVEVSIESLKDGLLDFLLKKSYIKQNRKYLFISNFGATFLFEEEI